MRLFDIAQTGSLETVVKQLTQCIGELTGIGGWTVVLIDPCTLNPTFAGGIALPRSILAAMEEVRRRGAPMTIWQAYTRNRTVVERNWRHRAITDPKLESMRPFVEHHDLPDLVALPLQWHGQPIGVLAALAPGGHAACPDVLSRWRHIAFEATLALQYSAAIRDALHTGTDHERLRMREELHDSVSQRLFGVSMLAARAESDAKSTGQPALARQLEELRSLIDQASADIQTLIGEPQQIVDDRTLSSRLSAVIEEFADSGSLTMSLRFDQRWDDLNPECADDVVKIVRECLRNVAKHARATSVSICLSATADEMLLIEVADNGTGFDPEIVGQASFGLSLITERALGRGGRCEVCVGGCGTTMRIHLVPEFESEWQLARRGVEFPTYGGASG
jgi:signal transduction histidine kinase